MKSYPTAILLSALLPVAFVLQGQVLPTVFSEGYSQLVGVNVDSEGHVWVGEMGTGNDDARIHILDPDGTPHPFMTGLPSIVTPFNGELAGAYRAIQLGGGKVAVVIGGGSHPQARAVLVVDQADFSPGNPLSLADVEETVEIGNFLATQGIQESNPFQLDLDVQGNWYIADAGANAIVRRDKATGALSVLAVLDSIPNPLPYGPAFSHPVPTRVLAAPNDSLYVCQLTGYPFVKGAAQVFRLSDAGQLDVHAGGFTCLTDMAIDPRDGALCILQFARFDSIDNTLNYLPGSAAIIKLLPDGSRDTIARGISGLAPSMAFDPTGNLYVTDWVFGQVLKFDFVTPATTPVSPGIRMQPFPNPFSSELSVDYELNRSARVSIGVYDLNGRCLFQTEEGRQPAGRHPWRWTATDRSGQPLPGGLYVLRLRADDHLLTETVRLQRP